VLNKDNGIYFLLAATLLWALLSVMGSNFKVWSGSCGSEYPIDMVLQTDLFCEINKEQDND
jgi:predicted transporter